MIPHSVFYMIPALRSAFIAVGRRALVGTCAAGLVFIPRAGSGQGAAGATPEWQRAFAAYMRDGKTDSGLAVLHRALASGDSAAEVARFALHAGNDLYRRGATAKNLDTLNAAIPFFAYGDSVIPSDPAKYLMVASQVMIGWIAERQAVQAKSCAFAREAQSHWREALAAQALHQLVTDDGLRLDSVRKVVPAVDAQVASYCH